jgi:hypothetical protein
LRPRQGSAFQKLTLAKGPRLATHRLSALQNSRLLHTRIQTENRGLLRAANDQLAGRLGASQKWSLCGFDSPKDGKKRMPSFF